MGVSDGVQGVGVGSWAHLGTALAEAAELVELHAAVHHRDLSVCEVRS